MNVSDTKSALIEKLEQTGLADRPGALLYSSLATLRPGPLYMLGYNPGGSPDAEPETVKRHLEALAVKEKPDWSEYVDEIWSPGGRPCAPGAAGMQVRVRRLLASIGLQTQSVCASNLIFVRSSVAETLSNPVLLAQKCWPVHEFILELVRPKAILSIGKEAFDFIVNQGRLLSDPQMYPSGHGNLLCRAANIRIRDSNVAVVSVPHLGDRIRYDLAAHPEVVAWAKSRLGFEPSLLKTHARED